MTDLLIENDATVLVALKQMDRIKRKLLIVVDHGQFKSLVSIGDIQRAILQNVSMEVPVSTILRKEINVAHIGDDMGAIREAMRMRRIDFMPVLNEYNEIADVIFWEDLFLENESRYSADLKLPVVIMAGGKGTRLKPLTNVLPKPLIPIGDQTMLEDIMDRFVNCGCDCFYVSVNYKADVIKRYFDVLKNPCYKITYFNEVKPLGTAGSLYLLKNKIHTTFFVSNCDILIDQNYAEIIDYHRENKNELTVVAAIKHLAIPYGTLETKENGLLKTISEKPEFIFKINTGLYVLEPHLLDEIPQDQFYHITSLIEKLCHENRKVGVFPISEGAWTDIGNWEEYINHFRK